ncbi:hypothetical protein HYW59_04015 [Candidatus Kaiserbacteria bacterium]|nr:hypothetical protein [Candidatus Kaiserbacteria bacterium]
MYTPAVPVLATLAFVILALIGGEMARRGHMGTAFLILLTAMIVVVAVY